MRHAGVTLLVAVLGLLGSDSMSGRPSTAAPPAVTVAQASAIHPGVPRVRRPVGLDPDSARPLRFELNRGQAGRAARFVARARDGSVGIAPTGALIAFRGEAAGKSTRATGQRDHGDRAIAYVRMRLVGANPGAEVAGRDILPGRVNYLGRASGSWTDIPTYARVEQREVYPGIDLVYYGNGRNLEFDFGVAPGADPASIVLGFEGTERLEVGPAGDLRITTASGQLGLAKPLVYQWVDGARRERRARYVLRDGSRVGIDVEAYDRARALVIDPVLLFSTYLGGDGEEELAGIALDGTGNVYVIGRSFSSNFPLLSPLQGRAGDEDVVISKLDPAGRLLYSTYVGSGGAEGGHTLAVDAAGNVYFTGGVTSPDFPTTPGAFDRTFNGAVDCYVAKLNAAGNALVYGTYLGGSGADKPYGIAVDPAGNAYVMGYTNSPNFPTTPGAFQRSLGGGFDAFVTKVNPAGTALVFSTFLGGSGDEGGADAVFSTSGVPAQFRGLAIDASSNVYVTGRTNSANFPTRNAVQAFNRGGFDAFVTKLDPAGGALLYSTYLGGGGDDWGYGITVDAAGNAFVTGQATAGFPTTAGVFSTVVRGTTDAFVVRLDPGGALVFSTVLGGSRDEIGRDVAVDAAGNVHVTGQTTSADFPVVEPLQASLGGAADAFVARLSPAGTALLFSTYLGGSAGDSGVAIVVDAAGQVFVAGLTQSTNFPVLNAVQPAFGGGPNDGFVAGIALGAPVSPPTVQVTLNGGQFRSGQTLTIVVDARNPVGNAAADLYVGALLPDGQTLVFLSDHATLAGTGSLASPTTFARALVAGPGFALTSATFLQLTFPPTGVPPGTYQVFAVLARQAAFADNRIDPGDVLASDVRALTFAP